LIITVTVWKVGNGILKSHYVWAAAIKKILDDDRAGDAAETKPVLNVQWVISPPLEVDIIDNRRKI